MIPRQQRQRFKNERRHAPHQRIACQWETGDDWGQRKDNSSAAKTEGRPAGYLNDKDVLRAARMITAAAGETGATTSMHWRDAGKDASAPAPRKYIQDNNLGTKGAFAKDRGFAKEGKFDTVGNFAKGRRARAATMEERAVRMDNDGCGSNQSNNVSERNTGDDTNSNLAKGGDFAKDDTTSDFAKGGSSFEHGSFSARAHSSGGGRLCQERQLRRVGRPMPMALSS